MLFLVEGITALASFGASLLLPPSGDGSVYALRMCLAGFLLLLICSHAVTYALLCYWPKAKEIVAWSALSGAIVLEIARNA